MADKKGETKIPDVKLESLSFEQLLQVVKELKRDDDAEARKAQKIRDAQDMALVEAEKRENQRRIRAACDHKREDGKWNVAWAPYADNIPRGTCQTCHDEFIPEHPQYKEMLTNGSTKGFNLTYHR